MSVEKLSRPLFTNSELPLSSDMLLMLEAWMMEEGNWRDDHWSPSAGEHYRYLWKWDETKGVVISARRGDPDRSAIGLKSLLKYVDPMTGFNPNKIFATADGKTWRDYPEAAYFNNNKIGTSYSQPPLEAWAAIETYESFVSLDRKEEGLKFLREIYGKDVEGDYAGLKGGYAYFHNHRQNLDNALIGIVHPNETGRDSDEANKPWLVYSDKKRYDAKLEWLQMQKLGWDLGRLGRDPNKKRVDWIPEKVRDKYWVNDVMFNAMYVRNLRYMVDIAGTLYQHAETAEEQDKYGADIVYYTTTARNVEREILDHMWDPQHGYFYNLDRTGNRIPVESVTGMFALMLENISAEQTTALVEKLEDPTWFKTPFPIPTHAVRSRFYDPEPKWFKNKFTPQWSGTVWADVNQEIGEALAERAEAFADPEFASHDPELALRLLGNSGIIAAKTHEMISLNPKTMEYYSPLTGKGMRVTDFMWTLIGLHFEKYEHAKNRLA